MIFDVVTGQMIQTIKGAWPPDIIWTVAFSPDGTCMVSSGEYQQARVLHVATGQEIGLSYNYFAVCLAISPNRCYVAVGGHDGYCGIWMCARSPRRSRAPGGAPLGPGPAL